jgi:uncharacterized protein (TIGR00106 family)
MLAELSIIPVGGSTHSSSELAKVLKLVDESGLPYQLTPSGTCIEGEWDEIMGLIRHCHDRVRKSSSHVVTFIKLEEDDGGTSQVDPQHHVGRRKNRPSTKN